MAENIASRAATVIRALPRFPSVARDISILIDERLPAADVRQTILEAANEVIDGKREWINPWVVRYRFGRKLGKLNPFRGR